MFRTPLLSNPRANRRAGLVVAVACVLVALPASSQQNKQPKTHLWMDVATHAMPGMPDMGSMGPMGGLAMRAFGGDTMQNTYGTTRRPAMPGKYLDIALLNQLAPGKEAQDVVPAGLQLGESLPLVPPKAASKPGPRGKPSQGIADGHAKSRILLYWGCGSTVRAGQPKEIRFEVKDGRIVGDASKWSTALQGRYAPDRTVDVDPRHALWPNETHRRMVPANGSLVGKHDIEGEQIPASMQFDLTQLQDFMPKIALSSTGTPQDGLTYRWRSVDRAKGYFLAATGMQDDALVLWSSSETPDAGMGIIDYLSPSTVEKWIREKVLLAPATTTCTIPGGIFAGSNGKGGGMLQMIAYGPETHIVYPPKPADPKAPWNPEWDVRVRNKSTATAMLGMTGSANESADETTEAEQPAEKPGVKRLLRGILGR